MNRPLMVGMDKETGEIRPVGPGETIQGINNCLNLSDFYSPETIQLNKWVKRILETKENLENDNWVACGCSVESRIVRGYECFLDGEVPDPEFLSHSFTLFWDFEIGQFSYLPSDEPIYFYDSEGNRLTTPETYEEFKEVDYVASSLDSCWKDLIPGEFPLYECIGEDGKPGNNIFEGNPSPTTEPITLVWNPNSKEVEGYQSGWIGFDSSDNLLPPFEDFTFDDWENLSKVADGEAECEEVFFLTSVLYPVEQIDSGLLTARIESVEISYHFDIDDDGRVSLSAAIEDSFGFRNFGNLVYPYGIDETELSAAIEGVFDYTKYSNVSYSYADSGVNLSAAIEGIFDYFKITRVTYSNWDPQGEAVTLSAAIEGIFGYDKL